jgi:hypothetical protein
VAQESGQRSYEGLLLTWSRKQDGVLVWVLVWVAALYWESSVRAAPNLKDDGALHQTN